MTSPSSQEEMNLGEESLARMVVGSFRKLEKRRSSTNSTVTGQSWWKKWEAKLIQAANAMLPESERLVVG
jgi:hypothetical protein